MGIFLYPENYEEPVIVPPVALTPTEITELKRRITNGINTKAEPVSIKWAIDYLQKQILLPANKHVRDDIVKAILLEVRDELGYPGQYRNAITAFADAGSGFVTVTSADHELVDGESIEIILTTNYDGEYIVSEGVTGTFNIEATWVADDATGVVIK